MINTPNDNEIITVTMRNDDFQRLSKLLRTLRMVDGWCRVNRAIGKFIIVGGITLLVLMSQGFDAIKNILGFKH